MLRLQSITKDYTVADTKVKALKGIDISFRKNEFVSVLGPSGCGKTTLLNIIGGLDKYSSGDLYINGVSTKEFGDREWDIYRNHHIGFIFQSYNLIPHQTVLKNVELALTISGMGKEERAQKAKEALEKVGLAKEINKRPNQLSGGQSQRVAIARALVNDPDILLADEPTGALDTETSKQIMDLIKEIAEDRLVIMVTHNPDLADEYSTRIVRLLDGNLQSDSNPFSKEEEIAECDSVKKAEVQSDAKMPKKKGKSKMSFFTAFKLSLNNLFSKRKRTIMTSIAGSIGIIGISLVLAFSYGIQLYIVDMQNDMLSGNPIEITQSTYDLNSFFGGGSSAQREALEKIPDMININASLESMVKRSEDISNILVQNTITQDYVDYLKDMPANYNSSVYFNYGLDISHNVYTDFTYTGGDGGGGWTQKTDNVSLTAIRNYYTSVLEQTEFADYASYVTGLSSPFRQSPIDTDYLMTQYNILDGKVATAKDEIMIVLNKNWELNDLVLAQLGYYTQDEFVNLVHKATENSDFDETLFRQRLTYERIKNQKFVWYPNDEVFFENSITIPGMPAMPFGYNYKSGDAWNGVELKIVGILEPKPDLNYGSLSSGFYYTEEFRKFVVEQNSTSEIVEYYRTEDISSLPAGKLTDGSLKSVPIYNYTFSYIDEDGVRKNGNGVGQVGKASSMSPFMGLISDFLGISGESETTYMLTLQELGGTDLPTAIFIYNNDFDQKQLLLGYLDKWNSEDSLTFSRPDGTSVTLTADDREKIQYTDGLSLLIDMINQFIDIVTTALIGFTSLALVVSCVMIGIITYVSVVERTKEIGVIRSLGGRKRDVGYLFNAETFILGLGSGLIGVGFTWLASSIINLIVRRAIGMAIAVFPINYALLMLVLSIGLTVLSGLVPSRAAAKKDPVVALRTE